MDVQFYMKQINVNLAMFYYIGCCMYRGSSEMKCPVVALKV